MRIPFGLAPKSCRLVPFGAVASFEASVQTPTSCSLSVLCWATEPPDIRQKLSAAMTNRLGKLLRAIMFLLLKREYSRAFAAMPDRRGQKEVAARAAASRPR